MPEHDDDTLFRGWFGSCVVWASQRDQAAKPRFVGVRFGGSGMKQGLLRGTLLATSSALALIVVMDQSAEAAT